jgi:hypothetical protein
MVDVDRANIGDHENRIDDIGLVGIEKVYVILPRKFLPFLEQIAIPFLGELKDGGVVF